MLISSVAVRSKNIGSASIMTSLNVASLAASLEVDSSASAERAHDVSCFTMVLKKTISHCGPFISDDVGLKSHGRRLKREAQAHVQHMQQAGLTAIALAQERLLLVRAFLLLVRLDQPRNPRDGQAHHHGHKHKRCTGPCTLGGIFSQAL